jgi:hypothetical protein
MRRGLQPIPFDPSLKTLKVFTAISAATRTDFCDTP